VAVKKLLQIALGDPHDTTQAKHRQFATSNPTVYLSS
jgi:hypothetical protein